MSQQGKVSRQRLDGALVARGLVASREQAGRFILAGCVRVNGVPIDKRATLVDAESTIEVVGATSPYVSRAGEKLAAALDAFQIDCQGRIALDVGASTGGFTDCLLQRKVSQVYAVDVGYGQLDWRIRNDPRVVVLERCNIRYLDPGTIPQPVDLAVIDVSFISLKLVVPKVVEFLAQQGLIIALVKPQFEAGIKQVGRGGVVRDDNVRREVTQRVVEMASKLGLSCIGTMDSPVAGKKGNREIFVGLQFGRSSEKA